MWELINKSSQIIGIFSIFPIIYSAIILWIISRNKKRTLEQIRKEPGDKPGILIVDCVREGGGSIQLQVETYLWQQEAFKSKQDISIIKYVELKSDITHKDIDKIISQIKQATGDMQSEGVTKYHIFMRVPVSISAMVGGLLYNYRPSIVYQQAQKGGYESWGAIQR